MPSRDSRQIPSPIEVPISPPPSPTFAHERSPISLEPAIAGPAISRQKYAGNRTAVGPDQTALGIGISSLLWDPLQSPLKAAHMSKDVTSSLSPSLARNLRRRLGHYTLWQIIVIFAFAFYTVTFFRALAGVGYIPNNSLQHRHKSSMKAFPHRGGQTTFSSIFGRFQLMMGLAEENVMLKGPVDIPHDRRFGTPSSSRNVQQRVDHRLHAGAWKSRKSKSQRMEPGTSDGQVGREDADTSKHEGFAYAISHSDQPRRDFVRQGGELTEHSVDSQS